VELNGRSAIVTGGAGGLGGATVRRLAEVGAAVAIFDRDTAGAEALAKELGDRVVAVGGDVNDDDAVAAAVRAAVALAPLGLVVNVAGGGVGAGRTVGRDGSPHDKEPFIQTMEMNAFGTFNVTRLSAAAMAANEPDDDGQRGVVVNTASIAGIEGQTGQVSYAAAKAAILGMTLPIARDLAPLGIRVCAIAPGTMGTPLRACILLALRSKHLLPSPRRRSAKATQTDRAVDRAPQLRGVSPTHSLQCDRASR
jgi:NAD(P)-dependent dehydrogenase (short-subunit alcohol dehydrogenase family)